MNTITIFDGSTYYDANLLYPIPVVFKGTYEVSDYVIRRDITQLKTSEVIITKENSIMPQDIILFNYDGLNRFGKVYSVETDGSASKVLFTYGADIHQMSINLHTQPSFAKAAFNNRQPIFLTFTLLDTGLHQLSTDDSILTVDTCARQILRRRQMYESYTLGYTSFSADTVGAFVVKISDYSSPEATEIKFRLDDPFIKKSYLLKIGQDKLTRLRLYNGADPRAWRDYQLLNDGSIVENTTVPTFVWDDLTYAPINANSVRPQRLVMKDCTWEEAQDINYAKDIFSQSEYDNEIEIEIDESDPLFYLGSDLGNGYASDSLLTRPVTIYLPGSSVSISTKVSGYEISKGVKKIIFGLARTRLTDVINNYVNKDNR